MAFDLSVIVIVKNEQHNIKRALESVLWADEIIIVDSGSTDQTLDIAKLYTDHIYEQSWLGYGPQKAYALSKATKKWVLSLDADEVVSDALADEIKTICQNDQTLDAYRILRKSYFGKKMIRYGDWKVDSPIRLFRKDKGRFSSDIVHEKIIIEGTVGNLTSFMRHYTYNTISDAIKKADEYSSLGAEKLYKEGKRSSILKAVFKSLWAFVRSYLIKRGFLDGKKGFILARTIALTTYLKYAKLNELWDFKD